MGITITETRVQDQSSSALNIKDIINIVYPVGSIYMSVNDTDPSLLFHGTWERIKDRFLLASGDTYSEGSIGGEAQHTLTVSEIPSHRHPQNINGTGADGVPNGFCPAITRPVNGGTEGVSGYSYPLTPSTAVENWGTQGNRVYTDKIGLDKPHNNMPPYLTVYMWKRIAYEDSVVLSLQNGRLVMYQSKVSQDGINFILSNHKNLIVMHTDKVDFDIVDHQRLEASYK